MTKYLLDTCLILGLFKRDAKALALMENILPQDCYTSIINRIELLGYHGISAHDEAVLADFLANIICLPLSDAVANAAITVRKRHQIKLPDSIVLATAISYEAQLLTLDNGLARKYEAEVSGD